MCSYLYCLSHLSGGRMTAILLPYHHRCRPSTKTRFMKAKRRQHTGVVRCLADYYSKLNLSDAVRTANCCGCFERDLVVFFKVSFFHCLSHLGGSSSEPAAFCLQCCQSDKAVKHQVCLPVKAFGVVMMKRPLSPGRYTPLFIAVENPTFSLHSVELGLPRI